MRTVILFCFLVRIASPLSAQQSVIDSLTLLLNQKNADTITINLLNQLAEKSYNQDTKKSLDYAQEALMLSSKLNYDKGTKGAYNVLRRVHRRLGNYEAAIRFTLNTLPVAERLKDTTEMLNCYTALGNIYSGTENYKEARYYFSKALKLSRHIQAPNHADILNFIGRNFGKMGMYDSAFYFIQGAQKIEERSSKPGYTLSYIYNNLAEVFLNTGNYKLALEYYTKSLSLPEDQRSSFGMTFTLNGLAKTYDALDQTDKALEVSLRSIDISRKNSFRDRAKETYGILYDIYEKKRDHKNALYFYQQFNLYQDSIFSEEKIKTIENLKINYETEKIANENELLRKDAELKNVRLNIQFTLAWVSILGIAALLVVIFLLYRNNLARQKTNKVLGQFNKDLAEQIFYRTQELVNTNTELIRQNNQLEQFGYITAHNLRAPVARILGLTNIINSSNFSLPEDQKVVDRLHFTALELDTIIHDLNSILDVKKGISNTFVNVNLTQQTEKVKSMLLDKIRHSNTIINTDFSEVNIFYTVPAYIESILYNLISNSIKYRSAERSPVIDISTHLHGDSITIIVEDNGIGIDLDNQKDKVFNLYQRFHYHVEGKGLGLFLVKTQVEAMNGNIDVESRLEVGTLFKIFLPVNSQP